MPTFEVKQVTVPLFGVVEAANQAQWLKAFATTGASTTVQVDEAALAIIAEELERDADGLFVSADRYVSGRYRHEAGGIDGSELGCLGEVLTFLVNRAAGSAIMRVVSWRAAPGQVVQGSRFPQPDFIVTDSGGSAAALEVKSTEAFDYLRLRDTKKWTWLQPCSSVAGCRERALPQLAHVGGAPARQQHSLVQQSGVVVPFPVGKGIATAVIAVDGRTNDLRHDPRFKTPKVCRSAHRDCWSCIPSTCHFVLVTMPNAPGALSLAGVGGDGSSGWFRAYQRWTQALAARDMLAVQGAVGALSEALANWLASPNIVAREALRAFWGSYLHDAMRSRGFDVEVPGHLGDLSRPGLDFEWSPAPVAEPTNREASIAEIARLIGDDQVSLAPFAISARLQRDDGATNSRLQREPTNSLSVGVSGDFVDFRLTSDAWWTEAAVETVERASAVAWRLLLVALETSGFTAVVPEVAAGRVPLREVVVLVGDQRVHLGWESKPAPSPSAFWGSSLGRWPFWLELGPWPPWPLLLALGDPRVRLRVLRDGRADLRVHRALLGR